MLWTSRCDEHALNTYWTYLDATGVVGVLTRSRFLRGIIIRRGANNLYCGRVVELIDYKTVAARYYNIFYSLRRRRNNNNSNEARGASWRRDVSPSAINEPRGPCQKPSTPPPRIFGLLLFLGHSPTFDSRAVNELQNFGRTRRRRGFGLSKGPKRLFRGIQMTVFRLLPCVHLPPSPDHNPRTPTVTPVFKSPRIGHGRAGVSKYKYGRCVCNS